MERVGLITIAVDEVLVSFFHVELGGIISSLGNLYSRSFYKRVNYTTPSDVRCTTSPPVRVGFTLR